MGGDDLPGSTEMLSGDNPGAGKPHQAPAPSPECFIQVQSRLGVPNPVSAQQFVGNGEMLALTCLALFAHPHTSSLGSSFVCGGRRDCSNLIFHFYCSVHSPKSNLQAYSNCGLNMGIFISFQTSFYGPHCHSLRASHQH